MLNSALRAASGHSTAHLTQTPFSLTTVKLTPAHLLRCAGVSFFVCAFLVHPSML